MKKYGNILWCDNSHLLVAGNQIVSRGSTRAKRYGRPGKWSRIRGTAEIHTKEINRDHLDYDTRSIHYTLLACSFDFPFYFCLHHFPFFQYSVWCLPELAPGCWLLLQVFILCWGCLSAGSFVRTEKPETKWRKCLHDDLLLLSPVR